MNDMKRIRPPEAEPRRRRGTVVPASPVGEAAGETADLQESLVESVVERLLEGLSAGRYAPGQRLIARDLADEFGVSRNPVREALHMLAGEGVVELLPNRGAVVRRLTVKDLSDLMELTEAICLIGVRLATSRMDEADNRRIMEERAQQIRDAYRKRVAGSFVQALYDYHKTLNEISGNGFVSFFYRRAHFGFFNRLLSERLPGQHWEEYLTSYERIHAAIVSGNAHAATATFIGHMQWAITLLNEEP